MNARLGTNLPSYAIVAALLLSFCCWEASAEEGIEKAPPRRIIMVGGVAYPEAAMQRLVEWAGGGKARILVTVWGNMRHPAKGTFHELQRNLQDHKPGKVVLAPTLGEMRTKEGREEFLAELAKATAIFFTGGDQEEIMKCVNDAGITDELRRRHDKGLVFAGNSAGTAIMSATMLTGIKDRESINSDNASFSKGLGLIEHGITDQHFIERSRQNRLFSALLGSRERWGIGIDEGNAVALEDGRQLEVLGRGYVTLISNFKDREKFAVRLLGPAEKHDLWKMLAEDGKP